MTQHDGLYWWRKAMTGYLPGDAPDEANQLGREMWARFDRRTDGCLGCAIAFIVGGVLGGVFGGVLAWLK